MRHIRRLTISPAMVVACLALAVSLGGVGYAASVLPRNSVGSAQLKDNAVISKKVKNRSLRAVDFAPGQVPTGPVGPAGPQGPAGPAGPAGSVTKLTAVVTASGGLARSQGVTSATRLGSGDYEVLFNTDVTKCTYVATLGNPDTAGPPAGQVSVAARSGKANGVHVITRASGGVANDRPFHILVVC